MMDDTTTAVVRGSGATAHGFIVDDDTDMVDGWPSRYRVTYRIHDERRTWIRWMNDTVTIHRFISSPFIVSATVDDMTDGRTVEMVARTYNGRRTG